MGVVASGETRIMKENDVFAGLFLRSDFCAEHELGIKILLIAFGVRDPTNRSNNPDDYRMRQQPISVRLEEHGSVFYLLILEQFWRDDPIEYLLKERGLKKKIRRQEGSDLASCWNDSNVLVAAYTPETKDFLTQLYQAIKKMDFSICIGTPDGQQSAKGRSGLFLLITSLAGENDEHDASRSGQGVDQGAAT